MQVVAAGAQIERRYSAFLELKRKLKLAEMERFSEVFPKKYESNHRQTMLEGWLRKVRERLGSLCNVLPLLLPPPPPPLPPPLLLLLPVHSYLLLALKLTNRNPHPILIILTQSSPHLVTGCESA